jgi:Nucleotidyl transferase AbiEii toxin, Type IV TA system
MSDPSPPMSLPVSLLAIRAIVEWFESRKVSHVFIGGLAVSLIAQPRATKDIDAVVLVDFTDWEGFLRSAQDFGFTSRLENPLEFAKRARVLLLTHTATGVTVDISFGALPFEIEMIERAEHKPVGDLVLNVPTPEDLIISKAIAHRPIDLIDIHSILTANPLLDRMRVRQWVNEFADFLGTPERLERVEQIFAQFSTSSVKKVKP